MAVDGIPFALVKQLDLQEHLASVKASHATDAIVLSLHDAIERRLDLAELHLGLAKRRLGLKEQHQGSSNGRNGSGRARSFPGMTRSVDHWTSVVHTYEVALGIDPAPGGTGGGKAKALGTVTVANTTVPAVTVDSTSGPTATEGGQPGLFTIYGTGVTVPINFQIAASGADSTFDDTLYSFDLVTRNVISQLYLSPVPNSNAMSGSVSIPYNQPSVGIKLVEGDDSGAEGPGTEQDTLTILNPTGCCCGCGSGGYAAGTPNSATITLVDNDVTIQGPDSGAHASAGLPAVSQSDRKSVV